MKQHTILVVDDEPQLRRLLELRLSKNGYKVLTAENGIKAFEVVEQENVDIVLSDIRMPYGDGIQLLEKLNELEVPPIILMTGYADISVEEAIDKGAKGMFNKPIDYPEVLERIEQVLAS